MAGVEWVSSQIKEQEIGIDAGKALFLGSISACAVCFDFIAGAAHILRGAKQHADERSEKVRQLRAR